MIDLNESNFDLTNSDFCVVDFWGPWCPPCRAMMPVLATLESENSNVKFYKVNIDENQALAVKYNVSHLPTLLFMKDGAVVSNFVGTANKDKLQELINKHNV